MGYHPTDEQLRAWTAGELPEADTTIVEAHLEECEECAAKLGDSGQATDAFVERVRDMAKGKSLASAGLPSPSSERILEKPGSKVGPYKLLEVIGEGGMGAVWLAHQDEPVKREVALKIIKAGMDTKEVIARFESERQALAVMDHPNIARVLDAGATDTGRPYFVMEHVKGIPITEFCDQNKTSPEKRLELFCDTCRAVQHAHRKGVIHRDIKPSNILIALDNDVPLVKVIDFGLAKATGARLTEKTLFTSIGKMVGTPAYMSPEQAEGGALDVDTRTDVYSLGVLLYELLTGVTPFDVAQLEKAGYAEMQRIIRDDNPPTPSTRLSSANGDSAVVAARCAMDVQSLVKMLRGDLDVIVMKSLEKDRSRRYGSPNEFAADVQRFLKHEPIEARKASTLYRLGRMYRRKKPYFIGFGLLAASLVIGAVTSTVLAFKAIEARNLAAERLTEVEHEQANVKAALADSEAARQKSDAVSQLLVDTFESPDPARDGSGITVVEMLDHAADRLQSELADQPEKQADLKLVIAKTYYALRLNKKALPLAEQVAEYRLAAHGPDHDSTQDGRILMARILTRINRYDDAAQIANDVVQTQERLYGPDDERTLIARSTLGIAMWRGGNAQKQAVAVMELRKDLVERASRTMGPDAELTLSFMNNLANSYSQLRQHDEALSIRRLVLDTYSNQFGEDHPKTLHTLQTLVSGLRKNGDTASALPVAARAVTLSEGTLGVTHASTMRNLEVYAELLWDTGQQQESVEVLERRLGRHRDIAGLHRPDVHNKTIQLIDRFGLTGRHEKALLLGQEFVAGVQRTFGTEHEGVQNGLIAVVRAIGCQPGANDRQLLKAEEMADELCERWPRDAKPLFLRGIIRYRRANYPGALSDLKMSNQRYAAGPTNLFFKAMAQWHLEDSDQARKSFERAKQKMKNGSGKRLWILAAQREATQLIQDDAETDSVTTDLHDAK